MGVRVILPFFCAFFPFFYAFFPFFSHFSPFSSLFSASPKGQGQTTAIYCKKGEDPVCTDPVQDFPIHSHITATAVHSAQQIFADLLRLPSRLSGTMPKFRESTESIGEGATSPSPAFLGLFGNAKEKLEHSKGYHCPAFSVKSKEDHQRSKVFPLLRTSKFPGKEVTNAQKSKELQE